MKVQEFAEFWAKENGFENFDQFIDEIINPDLAKNRIYQLILEYHLYKLETILKGKNERTNIIENTN